MEDLRKLELLPNQLYSCKTMLEEKYKRCEDRHRFKPLSSCSRSANKVKPSKKAGKRKLKWNLEEN